MTFRSIEPLLKGVLSYIFEILLTMDINSSTYHKTRHIVIIVIFDPKPSLSKKRVIAGLPKGGSGFSNGELFFPNRGPVSRMGDPVSFTETGSSLKKNGLHVKVLSYKT